MKPLSPICPDLEFWKIYPEYAEYLPKCKTCSGLPECEAKIQSAARLGNLLEQAEEAIKPVPALRVVH